MGKSIVIFFYRLPERRFLNIMKRIITATVLVLFIVSLMAGCSCASGGNASKKQKAASSSKTEETLELIETTPEGGTVEKDSEGNTVTKDKDGNIKSVKDKNGKALDTGKYIKSHPSVKSGNSKSSPKKSSESKSNNKSKITSSKTKSGKTTSSKKGKKSDEVEEEKIPQVTLAGPEDHYDEEVDF